MSRTSTRSSARKSLEDILSREELEKYTIGYPALEKHVEITPVANEEEKAKWFDEFVKFKEDSHVYATSFGKIETKTNADGRQEYYILTDWPYQAAPGDYLVTVYAVKNGKVVEQAESKVNVEQVGMVKTLATMAKNNAGVLRYPLHRHRAGSGFRREPGVQERRRFSLMYNSIVVGYDESVSSKAALKEASLWVKNHGGKLHLVHAVYFDQEEFAILPSQMERRFEIGTQVCRLAKNDIKSEFGLNGNVESLVCEGEPPQVIVETALRQQRGPDRPRDLREEGPQTAAHGQRDLAGHPEFALRRAGGEEAVLQMHRELPFPAGPL